MCGLLFCHSLEPGCDNTHPRTHARSINWIGRNKNKGIMIMKVLFIFISLENYDSFLWTFMNIFYEDMSQNMNAARLIIVYTLVMKKGNLELTKSESYLRRH